LSDEELDAARISYLEEQWHIGQAGTGFVTQTKRSPQLAGMSCW
jgi:hypothetical protein